MAIVEKFNVPSLKMTRFALPTEEDVIRNLKEADETLDLFLNQVRTGRIHPSKARRAGYSRDMDVRQFVLWVTHHSKSAAVLISGMIVDHKEIAETYVDRFYEVAEMMKLYRRSRESLYVAILKVLAAFETKVLLTQSGIEV